jgi:hypothetical protein
VRTVWRCLLVSLIALSVTVIVGLLTKQSFIRVKRWPCAARLTRLTSTTAVGGRCLLLPFAFQGPSPHEEAHLLGAGFGGCGSRVQRIVPAGPVVVRMAVGSSGQGWSSLANLVCAILLGSFGRQIARVEVCNTVRTIQG